MPVAFLQTLLLFFVFSIPGYLMWKCLRPASASVITLIAVSFTTGYLVLTWLLYFLSLSFNLGFSAGNFLILSAAATLIFAFIARAGRDSCFPSLRPVPSWEVAAFIAALFVGFVYYQNYSINQILDTFCLKDNIRLLIEPPSEPAYLLRHIVGDQREGGPAFSAGWIAFFPGNTAGFRMVYAFCGFSIAFFTFLALRAALRKDALAFAVMLLASLHPYLFRIRGIDENLISLSVSTFLIWLLLRRESCLSPLIGFAAAYLFNIRHENILFMAAVVWFVIRHISTRSLPPAFGIFLLGTAPTALRHWIAMGSPFAYESFIMHREPFEHSLLGIKFGLKTLLNYPFHSEIVRTPFNPYPTFLMWPLYLARYSGFAACVITALGLFNCRRENRQMLTFAVIWLAPMFILLSLLENWDFPSKMNIVLVMFNGFYLLFALGLDSMAHLRLDFRSLLRPAAVSFLVPSAILAVNAIPAGMFPADARYIERNSCVRKENARYLENERNWIGSAGILPFGDLTDIIGRVINPPLIETPRLWNDTAGWHSDEAIKWMNAARQADGDEASFFLDIRQDPANHEAWISKQAVSVLQDEIVVFEGDSMTLEELAVDWSERPLRIEIAYSKEKRIIRISISTCRIEWFDVYCAGCMEVRQRDYNIPGRMGNADNKHPDEKSANFAGQKRKSGILIKAGIPVWVVLEDHVNPGADVIYSIEGLLDLDGFHPVLTGRRVTN